MVKLELTNEELKLLERALLYKIESIKTFEHKLEFIDLQDKLANNNLLNLLFFKN